MYLYQKFQNFIIKNIRKFKIYDKKVLEFSKILIKIYEISKLSIKHIKNLKNLKSIPIVKFFGKEQNILIILHKKIINF